MRTQSIRRKYGMIETFVECRRVSCEKIAKLLLKFVENYDKEFKVWLQ